MKIVLTVVLAAIILAAVWSGYRRGLILSAAQLAAKEQNLRSTLGFRPPPAGGGAVCRRIF